MADTSNKDSSKAGDAGPNETNQHSDDHAEEVNQNMTSNTQQGMSSNEVIATYFNTRGKHVLLIRLVQSSLAATRIQTWRQDGGDELGYFMSYGAVTDDS